MDAKCDNNPPPINYNDKDKRDAHTSTNAGLLASSADQTGKDNPYQDLASSNNPNERPQSIKNKRYESIDSVRASLLKRPTPINQRRYSSSQSLINEGTLRKEEETLISDSTTPEESFNSVFESFSETVTNLDATTKPDAKLRETRDASEIDTLINHKKKKMKDISTTETKFSSTLKLTPRKKSTKKYGWNFREFYAEILGTFILMALNNGIVATYTLRKKGPLDVLAQAYVAGIGAMMGIIVSLPISGGHINPAVSIAFAMFKKGGFNWSKVPHYVIGQMLGSFLAQLFLFVTYYDAIADFDGGIRSAYGTNTSTGGIFATFPGDHHPSVLTCIFDQIFGTALLLLGVCGITDEHGINVPTFLQPFFISLLVAALASGMGLNTGATLNPARDLSPRIALSILGYGWEPFKPTGGHYWYAAGVIGPIVGAIVGVFVYNFVIGTHLFDKRVKDEMRKRTEKQDGSHDDEEDGDNSIERKQSEFESSTFKSPNDYTMVNMATNGKEKNMHQNNLSNNSLIGNQSSNQRSKSVCYGQSGQQPQKRHSILGSTKEYVD